MKDSTRKLAIVQSVAGLLDGIDFDIIDGAESELGLTNGEVFTITINRKRPPGEQERAEVDIDLLDPNDDD